MAFEKSEWWEVLVPDGLVHSVTLNWKEREMIKYDLIKTGPQPVCFVKEKNGGLKTIIQSMAPEKFPVVWLPAYYNSPGFDSIVGGSLDACLLVTLTWRASVSTGIINVAKAREGLVWLPTAQSTVLSPKTGSPPAALPMFTCLHHTPCQSPGV